MFKFGLELGEEEVDEDLLSQLAIEEQNKETDHSGGRPDITQATRKEYLEHTLQSLVRFCSQPRRKIR